MAFTHLRHMPPMLAPLLLLLALLPSRANALPAQPLAPPLPGCTTLYAFDGQTALGGNNEDFFNPRTLIWFIPASPGRYGRVYFGYDDYIPQGGLNDQGVFFDNLALSYKAMPVTSQRPHFPGGELALTDEILSRSANVQDAIDLASRWNRTAGEWSQTLCGDRLGDSVIIDGDTILRKQGAFQLATNFRLVDHPSPPYPDDRYGPLSAMLSQAEQYTVALFREALDTAHAEGDAPTLYSQIYELKTGIIHLYQYHDFQHEVVLNLADELAKGPHSATIASLFPKNDYRDRWAAQQEMAWKANYEARINTDIKSASQSWMSGQYVLQEESEAGPVKIYLENDRLYMQKSNQLPFELFPLTPDTVFHPFFNGMDLRLTFQRDPSSWATGARGAFTYEPYDIALPYTLTRTGEGAGFPSGLILLVGLGLAVITLGFILLVLRKKRLRTLVESAGAVARPFSITPTL